jgi:hypothetical protein
VPDRRPFTHRLAVYLLGIAIGLIILGFFQAQRQRAIQSNAPPAVVWDADAVRASLNAAEPLLLAVEAARDEDGYPATLAEVEPVPGDLSQPAGNSGWRYLASSDRSFFLLSFGMDIADRYETPRSAHYDSRTGMWRVIDAGGVSTQRPRP